jgi:hypothetical protein
LGMHGAGDKAGGNRQVEGFHAQPCGLGACLLAGFGRNTKAVVTPGVM